LISTFLFIIIIIILVIVFFCFFFLHLIVVNWGAPSYLGGEKEACRPVLNVLVAAPIPFQEFIVSTPRNVVPTGLTGRHRQNIQSVHGTRIDLFVCVVFNIIF
jgi:hypothetical protein